MLSSPPRLSTQRACGLQNHDRLPHSSPPTPLFSTPPPPLREGHHSDPEGPANPDPEPPLDPLHALPPPRFFLTRRSLALLRPPSPPSTFLYMCLFFNDLRYFFFLRYQTQWGDSAGDKAVFVVVPCPRGVVAQRTFFLTTREKKKKSQQFLNFPF